MIAVAREPRRLSIYETKPELRSRRNRWCYGRGAGSTSILISGNNRKSVVTRICIGSVIISKTESGMAGWIEPRTLSDQIRRVRKSMERLAVARQNMETGEQYEKARL